MELGKKPRDFGKVKKILYGLICILIVGGILFVAPRFEWNAPQVDVKLDSDRVGLRPFDIEITEKGTGLAKVSVTLIAGGTEYPILSEQYDRPLAEKIVTVTLSPETSGIKEGPAVLRVAAKDRSYWMLKGNETILDKKVVLDLTPPTVELISDDLYINLGGSGFVIFRASPDTVKSGVQIAGYFFPASKGLLKAPNTYAVFFAHPYDVPADKRAAIVAQDAAGNAKELPLAYTLKNVSYRKSTLVVGDPFIQRKVAPLLASAPAQEGSLKEIFLKVNRDLRKENEDKITALCQNTADRILWSGPFHQMTNSKVEANFADERTYVYQGETIDHAYHLGYDLAVTKKHPVGAANSGIVVFAGDLGIYGNTVIIDHGLGIATLYGHLSSLDVQAGDKVEKKHMIGKTGETGLAGGDHLHFATLIHGVPVLPLEWWDGKWIKDNIQSKLEVWGQTIAGR
jgi:murein DD-endopeptidase MepM/ murein hydrolase activator NlpD